MKTSVIAVHDLLSVLTIEDVEGRLVMVPGVASATVNFAAGNATVRYDETRLDVADIKALLHQRGHQSAAESRPAHAADAEPVPTPAVAPAESAVPAASHPAAASAPEAAASKAATATPAAKPTPAALPAPAVPAGEGHEGHGGASPGGTSPMPASMAYEMGHGGEDMPAMVRDMRNRFFICLVFAIPIFVYAPMGSFFKPPRPPFGLRLDLWLFFLASAAILYPSWTFFVSAWRALKVRKLSMAVLVVLSVGTGYLFSVGSTFFFTGGGQFFEAVSVLLVFILLGHWLKCARGRARRPRSRPS